MPPGIAAMLAVAPPPAFAHQALEPLAGLGVGQTGKVGWADLRLAAVAGRARLVAADARVPYQVGRVHHRSDAVDTVYLTMPTGGVVQGDRLAVRVVAEPGVRSRLTTPAATKIYGMEANYALQAIGLTVGSGAWLEWLPEPTIPYAQARYQLATTLRVAPGGVLLWGETLLPGRVARGERHAFDWLALSVEIEDGGGRLVAAERQVFTPATGSLAAPGRLRDRPALGSLYLLAPGRLLTPLLDAIVAWAEANAEIRLGASLLPEKIGIVARVMSRKSEPITHALANIVTLTRQVLG